MTVQYTARRANPVACDDAIWANTSPSRSPMYPGQLHNTQDPNEHHDQVRQVDPIEHENPPALETMLT